MQHLLIDILEGKAENNIERKVVEPRLKIGDKVRIKIKKSRLNKEDIETHSRDIYVITEKTGIKNRIKNLSTAIELRRLYTDEELDENVFFAKARRAKTKTEEKPR